MSQRELTDVIEQMLRVIPGSEETLRADLERCHSSAMYSAPELMGMRWKHTAEALAERFGTDPMTEGWQRKLMDIWNPGWEEVE